MKSSRIYSKKATISSFTGIVFILLLSCAGMKQRVVSPPSVVPGADYVGMETCALCHEKTVENFSYTYHANLTVTLKEGEEILGCEACHGAGSLHVEAGGGTGQSIINPEKNPSTCFQCHLQVKANFNLQYHHPVREKRITCINCHSPHGEDIQLPKDIRVGFENQTRYSTCYQCHRDQARPYVFEHEALREGCIICHTPHGSINDKLLMENDANLCLKCHAQVTSPGVVVIGDQNHTSFLMQGTCWSAGCHTAVHGSNINSSLRY